MEKSFEAKFATRSGWLCLDFANTVDWHASAKPEETLRDYRDLALWAKSVGVVAAPAAEALIALGEKEPAAARRAWRQAIELREAIYRILSHRARGEEADESDLSALNAAMARLLPGMRLISGNGGVDWAWSVDEGRLDSFLAPVVWSAVQLLTLDAVERVGQCADDRGCGWLFYDTSRNKSRRWCDMKDCGNRAKSRRHYRKAHAKVT